MTSDIGKGPAKNITIIIIIIIIIVIIVVVIIFITICSWLINVWAFWSVNGMYVYGVVA